MSHKNKKKNVIYKGSFFPLKIKKKKKWNNKKNLELVPKISF